MAIARVVMMTMTAVTMDHRRPLSPRQNTCTAVIRYLFIHFWLNQIKSNSFRRQRAFFFFFSKDVSFILLLQKIESITKKSKLISASLVMIQMRLKQKKIMKHDLNASLDLFLQN